MFGPLLEAVLAPKRTQNCQKVVQQLKFGGSILGTLFSGFGTASFQDKPQNGPRRRSRGTISGRGFLKNSWSKDVPKMARDGPE